MFDWPSPERPASLSIFCLFASIYYFLFFYSYNSLANASLSILFFSNSLIIIWILAFNSSAFFCYSVLSPVTFLIFSSSSFRLVRSYYSYFSRSVLSFLLFSISDLRLAINSSSYLDLFYFSGSRSCFLFLSSSIFFFYSSSSCNLNSKLSLSCLLDSSICCI
jgi:hypothetical protein